MMTSKYGNGFTNYFLTNDGYLKKATNKDYKYIDLDRFLKMIESDKINQVDLIYNDEGTPISHRVDRCIKFINNQSCTCL